MNENDNSHEFKSVKIPNKHTRNNAVGGFALPNNTQHQEQEADVFYEIEYDSHPIPGVGKFVPKTISEKSQQIKAVDDDPIRERFIEMRDIARVHRSPNSYVRFFGRNSSRDNSYIFYKQAEFMADFTDDYNEHVSFNEYYPYYQLLSYEQLRTYFTWRTGVRRGDIKETSMSYAFMYMYELINNIGVSGPEDGLKKLMEFWYTYRQYTEAADKYMLRWLKDYFIYYKMSQTFHEFVAEQNLSQYYITLQPRWDDFTLYSKISKYNIEKSVYYRGEHRQLVRDSFNFVIKRLREICSEENIFEDGKTFDDVIFTPNKKLIAWVPFKDALFYQHLSQPNRHVIFSPYEGYICQGNRWATSSEITSDTCRQLVGYILKQTEVILRQIAGQKRKLTNNLSAVTHTLPTRLKNHGISLEKLITNAVYEFHRESTKTVVEVDMSALSAIRKEALVTTEKLIVEDDNIPVSVGSTDIADERKGGALSTTSGVSPNLFVGFGDPVALDIPIINSQPSTIETAQQQSNNNPAFTDIETKALLILLSSPTDLSQFANENNIMPEVLIDGINDKAMDHIGDNIIDEDFNIYDDYIDTVKKWI